MDRYPPIDPTQPRIWHGGDYNPDQWLDRPDILEEDLRLMELAGCNTFSVGIFAWTSYEKEEGVYTFDWLDKIMDDLAERGYRAVLATPTGAKPAWMSKKYPEIRRVNRAGLRQPHQYRHNHCPTSPVYRQKSAAIIERLAERYAEHPALALWHLSNEYSGECFCDLCLAAWREWLKAKYETLDRLNQAWWSAFWSHTFTAWDEIDPRDPSTGTLMLDWKRWVTHQTVDFMRHEIQALRGHSEKPVTTNFMGTYPGHDYWRFVDDLDVISDDAYPCYAEGPELANAAAGVAFKCDMNRAMKGGRPWVLMESCPSATNWQRYHRLKRPGLHRLEMLQSVGHGADSCQYFQWRKGRGAHEKFHGAVVDHVGHENTRVFRDVAEVGRILANLGGVVGATTKAEVALVHDWDCRWALMTSNGPGQGSGGSGWEAGNGWDKDYVPTCHRHYRPFWARGIAVDVIESVRDFAEYKLLVLPMLYMLKPGVAERIRAFVYKGGTVVTTYLSGIVDEDNNCWLGGWPGDGLRTVFGVWNEEVDQLRPEDEQSVRGVEENPLGLGATYPARNFCEQIHAEEATVLATYGEQFYAGRPALTVNRFGEGEAYYLATDADDTLLDDLYKGILIDLALEPALDAVLPKGVTCQRRTDGETDFLFLHNFGEDAATVEFAGGPLTDRITGETLEGAVTLPPLGSIIGQRSRA